MNFNKIIFAIISLFSVFYFKISFAQDQIIINADASKTVSELKDVVGGLNIDQGSQLNLQKFANEVDSNFFRIKLWTWQINENLDNYFIIDNNDLGNEIKTNVDFIHSSGGEVLLQIYGMPQWLSLCDSSQNSNCNKVLSNNVPEFSKYPPKDYKDWQKLIEKLISELERKNIKIDYFEIYGEPNLGSTWWGDGSVESIPSFLEHYDKTAKYILNVKPDAKIGGSAFFSVLVPIKLSDNCAANDKQCRWVVEFVNYIKKNKSPFDFFSWHLYSPRTDIFTMDANSYSNYLKSKGFDVPIFLTEWNINAGKDLKDKASTHYGSSFVVSALMEIIDSKTNKHNYYNLGARTFGLFNDSTPKAAFNAFKLFSMLGKDRLNVASNEKPYTLTITRGKSSFSLEQKDIRAISAKDDKSIYLLTTYYLPVDSTATPNYDLSKNVVLEINSIPFSKYNYEIYLIDKNHSNYLSGGNSELEIIENGNSSGNFKKQLDLNVYGTVLIKITSSEKISPQSSDYKNNTKEDSVKKEPGKTISDSTIKNNGIINKVKNGIKSFQYSSKKFFTKIFNGIKSTIPGIF